MNPWIPHLLRAGGGGGGPVLPSAGRTMLANLTSSLILDEGTGDPTWSRATKAWGFNELGYLEEIASGCAFFGGARLVRNIAPKSETFTTGWSFFRSSIPIDGKLIDDATLGAHRMYFTIGTTPGNGTYIAWFEVKAAELSKCAVGVHLSNESTGARVIFNLSTGEGAFVSGVTNGSFSSVLLADGWVRVIVRGDLVAASLGVFLYLVNDAGETNFTGDGIKGILVRKAMICDVTNYDASYVPEYVSVGVVATPFFGAGIDGAKYFETDWQGAPIAAANLIGFRREAAATNNLLQCRNLTQNAWGAPANGGIGSEILTNGTFAVSTDWTTESAAYWSISGGSLNLNAPDGAAAYASNSQTYGSLVTGKQYVVEFDYTHTSGSAPIPTLRGSDSKSIGSSTGRKTVTITCGASVAGYGLRFQSFSACVATIDNITIKEAPVQCAQTATGLDGIANTATTLTFTVADAIILQPITLASAARCASAYVKRRTGTGTISFTQDGGSTWTDITSQINGSTWSRVQITSTLANPSVGFKGGTPNDQIDVDCGQNEAGAAATSPIVTTTAAITRNADSLSYQTASNIDFAVGTIYGELQCSGSAVSRFAVEVGSATFQLSTPDANTDFRAYDTTLTAIKTGLSDITTGSRKRVVSWGPAGLSVTGDGLSPTTVAFDGSYGSGATVSIGRNINGYIGPVAIYNYQMTDAELQAITA